jgi:2-polyprenyl-3-methyl-5-hydroxy-6-metoxy-1,4-benzoquinol methylase
MKLDLQDSPRVFSVGPQKRIQIRDYGKIYLQPDEQVTFATDSGTEYDIVKKDWGYYATPSMNERLRSKGLSAVLVKSHEDRVYVFLVEKGHEAEFEGYIAHEGHVIVLWLDGQRDSLSRLDPLLAKGANPRRCLCGSQDLKPVHWFEKPPASEIRFAFASQGQYRRQLLECRTCHHILSVHDMNDEQLYSGDYVTSSYGDKGIRATFDRIVSLPPEKSDNVGRVSAIGTFASTWFQGTRSVPGGTPEILDIGSGLCVFLHRVKSELDWKCTALDPDARACEHARTTVGVDTLNGDFFKLAIDRRFDVITLNKVVEHVKDPIAMIKRAGELLTPRGFVYIEVPDAEGAALDAIGYEREEFTIDHPHVFSASSLTLLVARAGMKTVALERIVEPSSKYTLRAYASL